MSAQDSGPSAELVLLIIFLIINIIGTIIFWVIIISTLSKVDQLSIEISKSRKLNELIAGGFIVRHELSKYIYPKKKILFTNLNDAYSFYINIKDYQNEYDVVCMEADSEGDNDSFVVNVITKQDYEDLKTREEDEENQDDDIE